MMQQVLPSTAEDWIPIVAMMLCLYFGCDILFITFRRVSRKRELFQFIERALLERDSKAHKPLNLVPTAGNKEEATVLNSAIETRALIAKKKLDMVQNIVNLSHRCRAYAYKGKVNAIAEELYDEAYERAKALAASTKSSRDMLLYGVPISVKENNPLKGTYTTGGLSCRLRKRKDHTCLAVQVLLDHGAIPLCKGNVPQLMMLAETTNNIYGRTSNPWKLDRVTGGSSGGEAAIVAMGCAPFAIASDVAGSARIPASCCGIVGFKPTSNRFTKKGAFTPRKNDKLGVGIAIPTTVGPMARTVDDCALMVEAWCSPTMWEQDLRIPRLPFDRKEFNATKKLKIGYFATDNWFEPSKAVKRGLRETINGLEKAGHACVPFDIPSDGWENFGLLAKINAAEGNMRGFYHALEGEEMVPEYNVLFLSSNLPNFLRPLLRALLDKRRAHLISLARSGGTKVHELWDTLADLMKLRERWSTAFRDAGIDALIYPSMPFAAVKHGHTGKLTMAVSYMFIANLLLWPCGSVPVTTVKDDEQSYPEEDLPEDQRDATARLVDQNMKGSSGLPLSVSVMTPAYQDETCLRVMKEVERAVEFSEAPTAYQES